MYPALLSLPFILLFLRRWDQRCFPTYFRLKKRKTPSFLRCLFLQLPFLGDLWNGSIPLKPLTPAVWACSHVISTYVVGDVLHFAAFCTGLYAERVLKSEQLYALMEKVSFHKRIQGCGSSVGGIATKICTTFWKRKQKWHQNPDDIISCWFL